MGLPLLPPPLATAQLTIEEIAQLDQEIEALEKQLGRLRRLRGCRLHQLKQMGESNTP